MYQSIPLKDIWVILRKQNFNQNFNLIVDAPNRLPARHTDQRQSNSRNFSLKS